MDDVILDNSDFLTLPQNLTTEEEKEKEIIDENESRLSLLEQDVKTSSIVINILESELDILADINTITDNYDVEVKARQKAMLIIKSLIETINART